MSRQDVDSEAVDLIRRLNGCRKAAKSLGFEFLTDMLSAAIIEAAIQSLGSKDVFTTPGRRLEELINLKLAIALGRTNEHGMSLWSGRGKDHDNENES